MDRCRNYSFIHYWESARIELISCETSSHTAHLALNQLDSSWFSLSNCPVSCIYQINKKQIQSQNLTYNEISSNRADSRDIKLSKFVIKSFRINKTIILRTINIFDYQLSQQISWVSVQSSCAQTYLSNQLIVFVKKS